MREIKNDAQIQRDVLEELRLDSRVAETAIGVTVSHGIVTLVGTLESWTMKDAAQEAAHRVEGVLDVANELQLKLPGLGVPTDGELAERVRRALTWDDRLPEQRIRTTVTRGTVFLEGEVDSAGQRDEAARVVRKVIGVTAVTNRIVVRKGGVDGRDVEAAITAALQRQAHREAQHVHIEVHDGSVTLTGNVHSWSERRAIVGTVRGTPGVDVIIDDLRVGS
jgi:osmotically-inducible protein OsmY